MVSKRVEPRIIDESKKTIVKNELLDKFFDLVSQEGLYSKKEHLRFHVEYLFKNTIFDNKIMLDIGSGTGLFSFYAACNGAKKVICIEPKTEGYNPGSIKKFMKLRSALQLLDIIELEETTFQNFNSGHKKFDILLLHGSINHLDENACINLQNDFHAIESYKKIFEKLYNISNKEAKLIILDASRSNFFAKLHLTNPLSPNIEWHKHQTPEYWAKLLQESGFCNPEIRWTTIPPLYSIGRILFSNKIANYFTGWGFCLIMHKG